MRFEKISKGQFYTDNVGLYLDYEDIKLPKRATTKSAGYDIFAVTDIVLNPGETIKLPTGIRVLLDDDKFLAVFPRSGLGFKYRVQLDNTVGIIDSDYYDSDNEGHIWIKLTNDSKNPANVMVVEKGTAICQGIILQYFKTEDDDTTEIRNGGFGSTTKQKEENLVSKGTLKSWYKNDCDGEFNKFLHQTGGLMYEEEPSGQLHLISVSDYQSMGYYMGWEIQSFSVDKGFNRPIIKPSK
jgi:dUTP pyrophosphatase